MRELTDVLMAISHPSRRAIISRLAVNGPTRFTDVAKSFRVNFNAISKHIEMLNRAGLITRNKQGREVFISLRPEPLRLVAIWAHEYEHFWNERLNEFEQHFKNKNNTKKKS